MTINNYPQAKEYARTHPGKSVLINTPNGVMQVVYSMYTHTMSETMLPRHGR